MPEPNQGTGCEKPGCPGTRCPVCDSPKHTHVLLGGFTAIVCSVCWVVRKWL